MILKTMKLQENLVYMAQKALCIAALVILATQTVCEIELQSGHC